MEFAVKFFAASSGNRGLSAFVVVVVVVVVVDIVAVDPREPHIALHS